MLDDRDRGTVARIELACEFEGGVRIVDVVVGKLLALQLARGRHTRPPVAIEIEAGPAGAGSRHSALRFQACRRSFAMPARSMSSVSANQPDIAAS